MLENAELWDSSFHGGPPPPHPHLPYRGAFAFRHSQELKVANEPTDLKTSDSAKNQHHLAVTCATSGAPFPWSCEV
jgi:hypothetical protein